MQRPQAAQTGNRVPAPAPAQWQDLAARVAKPRVDVPPKSLVPPVQDEHEDLAARMDNLHMDVPPKSLVPPAGAVSWQPSPFQGREQRHRHMWCRRLPRRFGTCGFGVAGV